MNSSESIPDTTININYPTSGFLGRVYDMHVTSQAIYHSSYGGERVKVLNHGTIQWAIIYGNFGTAMGISPN